MGYFYIVLHFVQLYFTTNHEYFIGIFAEPINKLPKSVKYNGSPFGEPLS